MSTHNDDDEGLMMIITMIGYSVANRDDDGDDGPGSMCGGGGYDEEHGCRGRGGRGGYLGWPVLPESPRSRPGRWRTGWPCFEPRRPRRLTWLGSATAERSYLRRGARA